MTKVLFVCLGNICRSPMAACLFRQMIKEAGCAAQFAVDSAGTSDEEEGKEMYTAAKEILRRHGVAVQPHTARQITAEDLAGFDYILVMEEKNRRALVHRFGRLPDSVQRLLSLTEQDGDVADPWYTRDFETAYRDIERGCRALLAACGYGG